MSVSTSNTSLLSLVPPPSRSGSSYFAYTFPPFYRFLLGVLMSLSNPQCLTILWAYPLVHLPQPQWLPVLPLSGLKPHLFPCRWVPPLGPCLLYLHPWRKALQWPNRLLCLYCLCFLPHLLLQLPQPLCLSAHLLTLHYSTSVLTLVLCPHLLWLRPRHWVSTLDRLSLLMTTCLLLQRPLHRWHQLPILLPPFPRRFLPLPPQFQPCHPFTTISVL